jgi:cation diffusion facilitator family transporter
VGHGHGDGHDHEHGHEHGHDHHHGGRWWQRLRPHSHDAADSVDSGLISSRLGLRTLWWSFAVLLATALGQAAVVSVSGSVALLGDTVHNGADALTAFPLAAAFILGRRVATRTFTYGLGRVEDLAGVVMVVLIGASSVFALYEAVERIVHPQPVRHLGWVALAGLIGFAGNEAVAVWRIRVGRRIGSAALVADGLHARTDGLTSLAVLLGAAGVSIGWNWADPVVGIGIAVGIVAVMVSAARQVFGRLLDGVDPGLVGVAEAAIAATPGVLSVDRVRLRWVGHDLLAEAEIGVDPVAPIADAHATAHLVEHALTHALPRLSEATVHVNPAGVEHGSLPTHAQTMGGHR